jgi:uncharacterized membrane protein
MRPEQSWQDNHDQKLSKGDRIADRVTTFIGSWDFILFQSILMGIWMALNTLALIVHFDGCPFVLLNLFMSAESAFSTPLILMSANRAAARDRDQAEHDYMVNLAAKEEIEQLLAILSRLESQKLDRIIEWIGILLKSELNRVERERQVEQPRRRLR